MRPTSKLLVVEDEPAIREVVRLGLEEAGYRVDVAADGPTGLDLASTEGYSAIVLDLMLPGLGGLEVCRRLRERKVTTPVLMLTARDAVPDRVKGLDVGADDYLTKPFAFDELEARIRALLRRDRVHKSPVIKIADLEIDTGKHEVRRAGALLKLTNREYTLLEALASHEGYVFTREQIQERVWLDEDSLSNTVDVYIGMLRKKVDAGRSHKLIQTVHGVGYTLRLPSQGEG